MSSRSALYVALSTLALVTACKSTPDGTNADSSTPSVQCTQAPPTGSTIKKSRCQTAAEAAQEQAQAESAAKDIKRNGSTPPSNSGQKP